MDFDDFKRIIDEVGQYLYYLVLFRGGESFMNKRFLNMVEYAYENTGAKMNISTNFSFGLSDTQLEIIAQCFSLVDVCLDGVTQETHSQNRIGSQYDKVFQNLLKLREKVHDLNSECYIRWRFVVFKFNEHEIENAQQIADDLGIELVLVKAFVPEKSWLPENKELWREDYIEKQEEVKKEISEADSSEEPAPSIIQMQQDGSKNESTSPIIQPQERFISHRKNCIWLYGAT
jgi:MoaA/NifB/PqqE/SkfB family radical SAM enzyme